MIAFKKLIFIGLAVAGAGLFKLFGRTRKTAPVPPRESEADGAPEAAVAGQKKVGLTK